MPLFETKIDLGAILVAAVVGIGFIWHSNDLSQADHEQLDRIQQQQESLATRLNTNFDKLSAGITALQPMTIRMDDISHRQDDTASSISSIQARLQLLSEEEIRLRADLDNLMAKSGTAPARR
jgi:septal ring factor EnvC (AmiA/AmiB activator)